MIKDSGERVSFETGAVRDVQDDKGRCDLMPLEFVSAVVLEGAHHSNNIRHVFNKLEKFQEETDDYMKYKILVGVLNQFILVYYDDDAVEAMLDLSIHFREGAEKYGEDNWKKGIPEWSYLSSAVRHLLKCIRGDEDESHKRAFMWNIMCLMWTINQRLEDE